MRGLAILGIVGAHSIHAFDWAGSPTLQRAFDTLCNQSSVLFFFIAGYLFQFLSARWSYQPYLKKKFQTVVLPYLILSVPALLFYTVMQQSNDRVDDAVFYGQPVWQQVLVYLGTGKHLAPFWFVPTITLFYLVSPFLLFMDRKGWWLPILPVLIAYSAYAGRDLLYGPFGKSTYLLSVYVLGMTFSRHRDRAEALATKWIWPLMVAEISLFAWNTFDADAHHSVLYFQKLVLIPVMVHWLKVFDQQLGKRLDHLAATSFGLFFVHGYLIHAARVAWTRLVEPQLPAAALWNYLPFAAVVLLLSLGILSLAQRTLGARSRMVVGC